MQQDIDSASSVAEMKPQTVSNDEQISGVFSRLAASIASIMVVNGMFEPGRDRGLTND